MATRVPGSTVIIIGTKMDLIPRESIADFEGQMRGYAENQFDSEVQSGNIKLGGVMFVSSNPKFKDFKKSKFF